MLIYLFLQNGSELVPKLKLLIRCFLQQEANNLTLDKNFSVYSLLPHVSCSFFKCRHTRHRYLEELSLTKGEPVFTVPLQGSGSTMLVMGSCSSFLIRCILETLWPPVTLNTF